MKITYVIDETSTSEERIAARTQVELLKTLGHDAEIVDADTIEPSIEDVVVRTADLAKMPRTVDDNFYREKNPAENEPMRVLLAGAWDFEDSGVETAYGAVAHARWFHQKFDLIRVSQWAPSREEPLDNVQEFHVALDLAEMTRLMHTCDALIGRSFAAEALAAGLPAVLTAQLTDGAQDYALFGPDDNGVELGERLIELLSDFELRERLRMRGRQVAEQWRAANAAVRVEQFFVDRRPVR